MAANKQIQWYAPKEMIEDPDQMGLYAVASKSPYPNSAYYFDDLRSKIQSELETELTYDGTSTTEIIDQLSSSFELYPFFDEAQIAEKIAERMQNRLQEEPVELVQVTNEDALRCAREVAETPQSIFYQSVCDLPN